MNIFYTDSSPAIAAKNLCNKHIVKMGTEAVQILSTAFPQHVSPYKHTHLNHPCCVWARKSPDNMEWLMNHAEAIFDEYSRRYKKTHASWFNLVKIRDLYSRINNISQYFPKFGFEPPPQCMPPQYKDSDTINAFRKYYIGDKARFAKWMNLNEMPDWWQDKNISYVRKNKP